jgi:hypothetical protein
MWVPMTQAMKLRRGRVTQAGRSAEEQFDELYRPWRRRMRLLFPIAVLPPCAILGAIVAWRPELGSFCLGAAFGLCLASYFWAVEPPDWMENWRVGAEGERRTGRVLDGLGPDWRVIHDIQDDRGNVDHVVVGPPGVFVVETKHLRGTVRVDRDQLVQTWRVGAERSQHAQRYARGAAARVSQLLRAGGVRTWVTAVVVVWGDLEGIHDGDNVTTLPGSALAGWLASRPATASAATVERVAALVEAARSERAAEEKAPVAQAA